ncbi:MAG: diacylglycerol kinase family lipid kinase [bacterium]|nr:diacylglycerol kinase family lipid kinase [bacterium]
MEHVELNGQTEETEQKERNERILVIVNPSAGVISKDIAASVIFKKLRKHFHTVSLINTKSPEHGFEIAKDALSRFDIITAFGGDGTINSIAAALVGTDKTLGVLPGGSGNGLVRSLNIPVSWRRALDVLVDGQDSYIDVGKINDTLFFNVAGIGLDALISKQFNLESKTRGITSYVYYALKGVFDMPNFRVKISLGDTIFQDEVMIIAFANFKQYGGKLIIAPFAEPNDGKLDICIINKFKILKESLNMQRLFTGHIHEFPFYKTYKFDVCEIESLGGKVPYHFDGEYAGKDVDYFKIETLPGKIKIRTPQKLA